MSLTSQVTTFLDLYTGLAKQVQQGNDRGFCDRNAG